MPGYEKWMCFLVSMLRGRGLGLYVNRQEFKQINSSVCKPDISLIGACINSTSLQHAHCRQDLPFTILF